jgi:hypothetical protein
MPPANEPLIGCWVRRADTPGVFEPLRADIELHRGVIVTGRVFDKVTGKGVESHVSFIPLPGEKPVKQAAHELALYASTDAAGQFRLVTLPGPGVLLAQVLGTRETINGVRVNAYPLDRYKPAEFNAEDSKRVKVIDWGPCR